MRLSHNGTFLTHARLLYRFLAILSRSFSLFSTINVTLLFTHLYKCTFLTDKSYDTKSFHLSIIQIYKDRQNKSFFVLSVFSLFLFILEFFYSSVSLKKEKSSSLPKLKSSASNAASDVSSSVSSFTLSFSSGFNILLSSGLLASL